MKTARKLSCLILALAMIFSLATAAFATSTTTHTITVNHSQSGHTYTAYQVFVGEYSNGKLTNVRWGSDVDGDAILTALKALTSSAYASCTTAEDVAEVLKSFGNDSTELTAFANVVNDNLKTGVASDSGTKNGDKYDYKINVTGDGYYFIKDTGTVNDTEVATKYLLKVVGDETITTKPRTVTVDKNIVKSQTEKTKVNAAEIGQTVDYQIDTKVPDMTNFTSYSFQIHDTLSKGLTFMPSTLVVKIDGTALTKDTDYTLTTTSGTDGTTTFVIEFKDFINRSSQSGKAITVTYSALVNEEAELDPTRGNPNEAHVKYSRKPGENGAGTPDGETPKSVTRTYVTGLELVKVDASNHTTKLTGAKFKISGIRNKKVLINQEMFVADTNGTYYRLKNGTYTTTAPEGNTDTNAYESTTVKYSKVAKVTEDNQSTAVEMEGYVNANGVITFDGLADGIYQIDEIVAPEGYNMLKEPIYIKISATSVDYTKGVTWKVEHVKVKANATADLTKPENFETVKELSANTNHRYELTVENKQGTQLPSTGGVGTTMFYVLGSILTLGAVVLLVTKKRMSGNV